MHSRNNRGKHVLRKAVALLLLAAVALAAYRLGAAKTAINEYEKLVTSLKVALSQSHSESAEEELMILINPWNQIPADYSAQLKTLSDGTQIDQRMYEDLMKMLDDCREAGHAPYICSGYRSWEKQQQLFDDKVTRLINESYTREEALKVAATEVAVPGTSEHQLGLAVDIVDSDYSSLDYQQKNTATQTWLMENCWEYGFILRYPENKSHITGIIYEPWHYRYVGKENAAMIHSSGLCLEEYLAG